MNYGFRTIPTDSDFTRRSAKYLAAQGYRPRQIRSALVEQLGITEPFADEVISALAC